MNISSVFLDYVFMKNNLVRVCMRRPKAHSFLINNYIKRK